MNQSKGFAQIAVVILVLAALGFGGYYLIATKKAVNTEDSIQEQSEEAPTNTVSPEQASGSGQEKTDLPTKIESKPSSQFDAVTKASIQNATDPGKPSFVNGKRANYLCYLPEERQSMRVFFVSLEAAQKGGFPANSCLQGETKIQLDTLTFGDLNHDGILDAVALVTNYTGLDPVSQKEDVENHITVFLKKKGEVNAYALAETNILNWEPFTPMKISNNQIIFLDRNGENSRSGTHTAVYELKDNKLEYRVWYAPIVRSDLQTYGPLVEFTLKNSTKSFFTCGDTTRVAGGEDRYDTGGNSNNFSSFEQAVYRNGPANAYPENCYERHLSILAQPVLLTDITGDGVTDGLIITKIVNLASPTLRFTVPTETYSASLLTHLGGSEFATEVSNVTFGFGHYILSVDNLAFNDGTITVKTTERGSSGAPEQKTYLFKYDKSIGFLKKV